jgi:hypothetical protein
VGLVSEGRFGLLDGAGSFIELPVEAGGSCADLRRTIAAFAVNIYPRTPERQARVAIFGVVSPAVRSAALKTATEDAEPLVLDRNSFLVVKAGLALDEVLTFTTADGRTMSYPLANHAIEH